MGLTIVMIIITHGILITRGIQIKITIKIMEAVITTTEKAILILVGGAGD
jgi:hypothetical protein